MRPSIRWLLPTNKRPVTAVHAVRVIPESEKVEDQARPLVVRRPASIPQRPLRPNTFQPPRGSKQVFLPNFVISMIPCAEYHPANYVSFYTPLWFNKLDMKDYLYNAYGMHVLNVRSVIFQSKLRPVQYYNGRPYRRWYRPISRKKMTVELAMDGKPGQGAFVWPEAPEDLSPWGGRPADPEEVVKKHIDAWREENLKKNKSWPQDTNELAGWAQDALTLVEQNRRERLATEVKA